MKEKGVVQGFAGGFSGALTMLVVQPLDVIKTRQQQLLHNHSKYRQLVPTVQQIFQEEGLKGFWKGSAPGLWRVIPGAGLNFLFLHHITSYFLKSNHESSPNQKLHAKQALLAGSLARSCATMIMMPFTVVKTRFEGYRTNKYKGTLHAVRTIYIEEGIRGLWSGSLASIIRDAPFSGIYFGCYTQAKKYFNSFQKTKDLQPAAINFASGTIAAVIATLITHPADLVKTRLQIAPKGSDINTYSGIFDAISKIYRLEGIKGLYKGIFPRLLRRPLASAITWSIYEELIFILLKKRAFQNTRC